jgi:hypothetical protein
MSLVSHDKGWKSFDAGRIWRCNSGNSWLMETDREGNTPSYTNLQPTVAKIRRIQSFYAGRINFGVLDSNGNGLDLLTANAMTESLGSVPSSLQYNDLLAKFQNSPARTTGDRLNELAEFIRQREKYLVRKEPGYINPVQTPGRISFGAHHMLISTALDLSGPVTALNREDKITELVIKLSSDSLFAAEMAVKYLNKAFGKHQNEPPLVAATYNAGSPRPDPSNPWNLRQYGDHIDRWTAFYNTSRLLNQANTAPTTETDPPVAAVAKNLELKLIRTTFTGKSTIGDLYIDETYHCHTLEDVVRNGEKVYGSTAIPSGRYEVIMTMSARFGKIMPLLLNVPGFEGVRIHKGNTAADTLGCLLVGADKGVDRIGNCTPVYDRLVEKITRALPRERVFITIG